MGSLNRSILTKKAWADGKYDNRDHTKAIKAMIAGRTPEHGSKISKAVLKRYKDDKDGVYGFRAVKDRIRHPRQRRILAEYALKQWQSMSPKEQEAKIRQLREGLRKSGAGMIKIVEFDSITFYHPNEILCYRFLTENIGLDRTEIEVNFRIGLREIDFFIKRKVFWEHHVCNAYDHLTADEYYDTRRKILDDGGFEAFPLLVTTRNEELDSKLEKTFEGLL